MGTLGPIDRVQAGMIDPERFARAMQIRAKAAQVAKAGISPKVAEAALSRVATAPAAPSVGARLGMAAKNIAGALTSKAGLTGMALTAAPSVGGGLGFAAGQAMHPIPGETIGSAFAEGAKRYGWSNTRGMD